MVSLKPFAVEVAPSTTTPPPVSALQNVAVPAAAVGLLFGHPAAATEQTRVARKYVPIRKRLCLLWKLHSGPHARWWTRRLVPDGRYPSSRHLGQRGTRSL